MMRLLLFILLSVSIAYCHAQSTAFGKGNKSYQQGDWAMAKASYEKALQASSTEEFDKVYYNLGNTFFKSGLFEQSEKSFDNAIASTKDRSLKASAFYNKGLSLIQQNKTPEAIIAFKNTLRLTPDDNDARDNLQKALNSLPKQSTLQKNKPSPSQSKQTLTSQQAEQLLDKLHEKEMQLQKQLHKQKSTGNNIEKDW